MGANQRLQRLDKLDVVLPFRGRAIMISKAKILLVMGLAMCCSAAYAGPEECASLPEAGARLTCFDKLFPKTNPGNSGGASAEPNQDAKRASLWRVTEGASPLDDSPSIVAILLPQESSSTGIGEASAYLIAACRENVTSVIIKTEMFMAGDAPAVTIRLGSEPAAKSNWGRSSDYKAVGLWTGKDAIPFLKSLKDDEKMFLRLEDRNRVEASFNLSRVSEVVELISQKCKWR